MKVFFTKLQNRMTNAFDMESLSKLFLKFTMVHIVFLVYANLQGQFVNTLLIRSAGNSDIVMYYNMISFAVGGFAMCAAVFFARRVSVTAGSQIGILLYLVNNLIFLCFMNRLTAVMPLLAVVNACAGGFYWISYSISVSEYSDDHNRDKALAFIGICGGVVALVLPLISGVIISAFDGSLAGYYIVFGLSFLAAVCTIFLSRRLKTITVSDHKTNFKLALHNVFTSKLWFCVMSTEFFKGIREGTFAFFLNLLLFEFVNSEALVGFNTLLVGIASIVSFYVIGKVVKPNNRLKSMFWSITALLGCTLLLYLRLDALTILFISVVNSFLVAFFLNPSSSILFAVLQKAPGALEIKSEYFGIKEIFLDAGRIAGIVVTLLMPKSNVGYVTGMCVLTVMQYGMLLLSRVTVRGLERMERAEAHE